MQPCELMVYIEAYDKHEPLSIKGVCNPEEIFARSNKPKRDITFITDISCVAITGNKKVSDCINQLREKLVEYKPASVEKP